MRQRGHRFQGAAAPVLGPRHPYWRDALLIAAWVLLVRLPSLPASTIDWDESEYILAAREVLHGYLPYVTVFSERPLGTPLLFAAALGAFGQSVVSVRLLGMICVIMTSLALHGIALRTGLSRGAALAAALLYSAYTASVDGLTTNMEIIFAPFTAWAFWVAANPVPPIGFRRQARVIAAAGLLIGLGIWIKYLPALPGCMLFAMLVGSWWRRRASTKAVAGLAAIYAVCCLLPTLLSAAVYIWAGRWNEFWYCNFGFLSDYVGFNPTGTRFVARHIARHLLLTQWPLLAGAAIAVALWRDRRALVAGAVLWLTAEVLASLAPGTFFDHYFLVLLPPLCLLAACGLDGVVRRVVVPRLGDLACLGLSLGAAGVPLVATTGLALDYQLNIRQPDMFRRVAAIIREDGDPNPTAWVVNSEPIIYFLAGLAAPTRFVFPPHLIGGANAYTRADPMTRTDAASEVQRILGTHPRYLVINPAQWGWLTPELRPLIQAAIDSDYALLARMPDRTPPTVEIYRCKSESP
jgi:4-amino-4-deoxy-L-arabinose transferase-like glycosyltransferase